MEEQIQNKGITRFVIALGVSLIINIVGTIASFSLGMLIYNLANNTNTIDIYGFAKLFFIQVSAPIFIILFFILSFSSLKHSSAKTVLKQQFQFLSLLLIILTIMLVVIQIFDI